MSCPHCGLPADKSQNGIQGYRCGSSYCETFRPQWARSMTCLEIQNGQLQERIKRLEDCIETAWGIIANVSGGDWTRQKHHWQEAAVRWRDNDFHPIMKELSERKAKEAKP